MPLNPILKVVKEFIFIRHGEKVRQLLSFDLSSTCAQRGEPLQINRMPTSTAGKP